MKKAFAYLTLLLACAVLSDCMSAETRGTVFYLLTGCKKKKRSCAGVEPVAVKDQKEAQKEPPRKQAPTEEPTNVREASEYMDALYEQLKGDLRKTDPNLKENASGNGFKGRGIALTKTTDEFKNITSLTMTFDGDIAFPPGGSALTLEAQALVDRVGRAFAEFTFVRLDIYGHTDTPGTFDANQSLSEARAKTVQSRLGTMARLGPQRFGAVKGLADSQKIVQTNADEPRNRRVEIRIAR